MKNFRYIIFIFLISFQLITIAQRPSFENFKVKDNPYLQFNDIVEYQQEIWLVSNQGIYQYKNNELKIIIRKENLAKFIKVENTLFVWSIYGEFFKINKKKLISMPFNSLLSKRLKNKIINSVIYNDSTFWISTVIGGGLIKVNQKEQDVITTKLESEYPYYITQFGNQLISGNNSNPSKKELAVSIGAKSLYIPLAENIGFSRSNIIQLKDGSFIFTRQYEAIRFDEKNIINRVFLGKNIECVYESSNSKVWFALNNGGLICYADGNFNSSNSIRYLGNKTVIAIIEDHNGGMWFGTSGNGVYSLKKAIELTYRSPKIFSSTNNKTEDIQSISIGATLPIIHKNSKILRTDVTKNNTALPVVFINSIKINGQDTMPLNYYELKHDKNNIEINISGIYNNNSELQYKYILEGRETKWNYSTNTTMYYSSLEPGNYTFKIYAMSDGGVWSKIPAVITFSITAPLYTSFWFIFSILFLVITLVLVIIFIINRKAQRRDNLLEEEKKKVLISELHALRSQMNPHFIFNTLSSIQSFITQNSSKDAVNYLSKFAKLMRATLENTQKKQIPIKDEIETLQLYMDLERLRLNNKFTYQIDIDDKVDVQFEQIPPMLIQPYVENAIWHGISQKRSLGKINIRFKLINENLLKCEIEDDGVGRKKAMELNREKKKNTSLGMSITKERLEIINSLKDSKLNVNIVDLEEKNKPLGTKIELFIPLD